jgi:cytochrome P450
MKRVPLPARRRYLAAVRTLDQILERILREGSPQVALFDGLGPREARDELMTLFIAGHETTASALSFAVHLAARNPDAQAAAARAGLIEESLRLYPPVWSIGREALENDRFGIKRGDLVLIPVWRIHRDPRFYPDPDQFRPDRATKGRPAGAYLPFGLGPRTCIGAGFARMEMDIALGELLGRFRLLPEGPEGPAGSEGNDPEPLALVGTLTARARRPIRVRLGELRPEVF